MPPTLALSIEYTLRQAVFPENPERVQHKCTDTLEIQASEEIRIPTSHLHLFAYEFLF